MVLIIIKIQSTYSPQLLLFIYNFFPHPYPFSEFKNNLLHTMLINNEYPWPFFIPDNRQKTWHCQLMLQYALITDHDKIKTSFTVVADTRWNLAFCCPATKHK